MGFWAKSHQLFKSIREHGQQSMRHLARHSGLSKSSVHRLQQARERRNCHAESWLWETEEGHGWLIRLLVATLYLFGLKRGVGTDTIREFFRRLRLEAQLGCSPSALRGVMQELERVIVETAVTWEHDGIAAGEHKPLIGAVDETFLERMMLVCMDLASGYVLLEEVAEDRGYEPWYALVKARLETLGVAVHYLVSDRAKALIKLAETGLACLSLPDVFPLIHDLVKSSALAIYSRQRQARQALRQAQECLAKCQASDLHGAKAQQAQVLVAPRAAEVKRWEGVGSAYRHHLEAVGLIIHPWRLLDARPQTSEAVERQLHAELQAIEAFVETHGLPIKNTTLDKVRKQLGGVSALVDVWWKGVWQDVKHQVSLTPMWTNWVEALLLPLLYGQQQVSRTRCPRRKAKLLEALKAVQGAFERHPITQQ